MAGGKCFGGLAADIFAGNDVLVGAPGFYYPAHVLGSLAGMTFGAADAKAGGIHAGMQFIAVKRLGGTLAPALDDVDSVRGHYRPPVTAVTAATTSLTYM